MVNAAFNCAAVNCAAVAVVHHRRQTLMPAAKPATVKSSNADACSYDTRVCDHASDDHCASISLSSNADDVVQGRRDTSAVVIGRHRPPSAPPPTAFERHHQPLLIVEYDLCLL